MASKSKKTSVSKKKANTSKKATEPRASGFVPVPSLEPEVEAEAVEIEAPAPTPSEEPVVEAAPEPRASGLVPEPKEEEPKPEPKPEPRASGLAPEPKKVVNWKAVRAAVYAAGYDTTMYGSDLDKVVEVAKAHGADAVRKLHWLGSANHYANLIARLTK